MPDNMFAVLIESRAAMQLLEDALHLYGEHIMATEPVATTPEALIQLSGLKLQVALAKSHRGGAAVVPF